MARKTGLDSDNLDKNVGSFWIGPSGPSTGWARTRLAHRAQAIHSLLERENMISKKIY